MSTTAIPPLTKDEARLYRVLYQAGTEPDCPFDLLWAIGDSIIANHALGSLVRKRLLTMLEYRSDQGGWLWETERGAVITTRGGWVYGRELREAYQAWYESQEDDDETS
ncbi:hypothetical protein [Nitrolancea hollandica]|uniref:Uncharacterized protein n=1 Tax=Nitrolancea hollandica Lb TaxID=1129897 RepID=I4EG01_9BACT|nr:hypothetical protein [Nitrolancea hollandica]CCF83613.1 hypothetical protein NITHO_2510011 [Nitrolancea hollandica Lb]